MPLDRANHSFRCLRIPRLIDELNRARGMQNCSTFLKPLAKAHFIILHDIGIVPMADQMGLDLLKTLDRRYDRKSTIITSQLSVD